MMVRTLSLVVLGLSMAVLVGAVAAQEQSTHKGTFLKAEGKSFTMTGIDGKEHKHMLDERAKVTCDGKDCQITDLKSGTVIVVTTLKTDPKMATRVEADTKLPASKK